MVRVVEDVVWDGLLRNAVVDVVVEVVSVLGVEVVVVLVDVEGVVDGVVVIVVDVVGLSVDLIVEVKGFVLLNNFVVVVCF